MPLENTYQIQIDALCRMFPDIDNFVVNYNSGIEDDDEPEYNQDMFFKCLGVLVTKLSEVGILFHDSSEVISSGGMRDFIPLFAFTFNDDIVNNILRHASVEFVEELSDIIHSDDITDSDTIHSVIGMFKNNFTLTNRWENAAYYHDLYYSTEDFVLWFRRMFERLHQLASQSTTVDIELSNFFALVSGHLFDVYSLICVINSRLNLLFTHEEIESVIRIHDRDLLASSTVDALSFDKSLNVCNGYHNYSTEGAKEIFSTHQCNNPHHIEYFIEKGLQPTKLQLVVTICDIYEKGMDLEVFENKCAELIALEFLNEESVNLIKSILSIVRGIDFSNLVV